MSPQKLLAIMTGLTPRQIQEMTPADRFLLANECERIHREALAAKIIGDARRATAPKSGVLARLNDGERSQ
jgi:hypothetical protein